MRVNNPIVCGNFEGEKFKSHVKFGLYISKKSW